MKPKKERPTWALFRHLPNNKEGKEFLRLFKKYKNKGVCASFFVRYRKPLAGFQYAQGGHLPKKGAKEFNIFVEGYYNWQSKCIELCKVNDRLRNDLTSFQDARNHIADRFNELNQMSIFEFICYKFKQRRK